VLHAQKPASPIFATLQPFEVLMGEFWRFHQIKPPMDEHLQGKLGALTALACELHYRYIKKCGQVRS